MTSKKPETGAGKMVRAFYEARLKKKEADFKLKQSLQKMAFSQKLKEFSEKKKQQAKVMSPEQQFLRRRFEEESPIAAMEIPEEGSDSQEVSFPATKVEPSSGGMMKEVNIPKEKQPLMFMTAYNKMIAAGKKPSPLATKIYEKYYKQVNEKARDENKPGQYKTNKATQDFLDGLADQMASGKITTRKQAHEAVAKNGAQLGIRGADVGHIYKQIDQFLPDTPAPKKKEGFIARIGNAIFKKKGDEWRKDSEDSDLGE